MGRYRVFLPPRLPRNLRPIDITSSAEEKVSSNDAHYLSPNPRRVSKSSHRSGHRLTHSRRPTTYSGWSVPYKPSPSHDEPSPRRPSTVRSESTFRRFNQLTSLSTTGQRNNAAECLQMYGRQSCPCSMAPMQRLPTLPCATGTSQHLRWLSRRHREARYHGVLGPVHGRRVSRLEEFRQEGPLRHRSFRGLLLHFRCRSSCPSGFTPRPRGRRRPCCAHAPTHLTIRVTLSR